MRTTISMIGLVLALVLVSDVASGHGGNFQGPAGGGTPGFTGPPGSGTPGPGPGGVTGSGTGGGLTGGGGGGATGGSGGGGPTGPGLRPGPSGGRSAGAGGRATPGRTKKGGGTRYNDWDWWWELNDDPFLNLKRKVRSSESASENTDTFLGAKMGDDVAAVTLRQIRKDILPTLKLALKDPYFDARSGAVIALGKIATPEQADVIDDLKDMLSDSQTTVREAACLGLAMVGSKEVVPLLFKILENKPEARKLLGRASSDVLNRTRAFAAVAIGLVGFRTGFDADDNVIPRLVKLAQTKDGASVDVHVAPALALGLIKSQDGVSGLIDIVNNSKLHEYVRAHAAVALGKVGAKSAIRHLVKGLTDKSNHVKRSCAIALGLLTDPDNKAVIKAIKAHAKSASDRATRNFCLIALGYIDSPDARAFLIKKLSSGQVHDRTFSAMGLGVASFRSHNTDPRALKAVFNTYKKTKSKSEKGCYAISLGLMGAEGVKDTLRADLTNQKGALDLKSHICTALGLLNDKKAIPMIRDLVRQRGDVDLRKRAAIALGLLRDAGAVEVLKKVIEESGASKAVLGAATVAMGFIGDRSAVPILKKFLKSNQGVYKAKDTTRAFATVALGFLGDKEDIPLLSNLQRGSNYLAQTGSLSELLSIL